MNSKTARSQASNPPLTPDAQWASVVARDPGADGAFVYAVTTTGVYCRPSCSARLPKRGNVRFFATGLDARAAGFRACKRCRPDAPVADANITRITKACRMIEESEEEPDLQSLARAAGLSPHHFHRVFKSVTGVTPKAYATAERQKRMRGHLFEATSVTSAIVDAGYNSSGRFYEASTDMLGMTPRTFSKGGANVAIKFAVGACSLGAILVAASAKGICAILLGDAPEGLVHDLQDRFPKANLIGGDKAFEKLVAKVVGFVEAPRIGLDLPLDIRGTAFQHRVWEALRKIPVGATASYSDIAKRIGDPRAVRAVATACAANAIAVAIPCHRVVRTDGALSGYRWGVERKRALLAKERK